MLNDYHPARWNILQQSIQGAIDLAHRMTCADQVSLATERKQCARQLMTNYPIQFLKTLRRIRAGSSAGEDDVLLHILSDAEFTARIDAAWPISPPQDWPKTAQQRKG